MELYKRPNSSFWWYVFTINGKKHRASTKRPFTDTAGAKRVMALAYEEKMDRKQFGTKPEVSMADAFDRCLKQVKDNHSTHRSYELCKRKFLGLTGFNHAGVWSAPSDMKLSDLTNEMIEDFQTERLAEGLAHNTVNNEMRVLKRVWNANRKRFSSDPDLTFPMLKGFEKTRFLSVEEEAECLAMLRENDADNWQRAHDLFLYLIDTGVRLSEALEASWSDINMSQHSVEVYRIKTGNLSLVPISDRVSEMLKRRGNHVTPFASMDNPVKILRKVIACVCNGNARTNKQRGKATIHSLRDTYASRLVAGGITLYEVSKLLGHSSMTMTRKYAHIEPQLVSDKARRVMNG